jgi:hypothetical protein
MKKCIQLLVKYQVKDCITIISSQSMFVCCEGIFICLVCCCFSGIYHRNNVVEPCDNEYPRKMTTQEFETYNLHMKVYGR